MPSSYIKQETSFVNNLTAGTAFQNISINPSDYLDLNLSITGNFKQPKVNLKLNDIKKSLTDNIKNNVANEIERSKVAAQKKADEELKKIKDDAAKRATDAKKQLQDEVNRQKKEAETKLREEADARKKQLEVEAQKQKEDIKNKAKDKLKDLFKQ